MSSRRRPSRRPPRSLPEGLVRVYPAPDLEARLGAGSYVRGVPAAGKELPAEQAQSLLDAGLVTLEPTEPADPPAETPAPSED